jgi:hypothetical protein
LIPRLSALTPSATAGRAVASTCWPVAATAPPATTVAARRIESEGVSCGAGVDRCAPPAPAVAMPSDSGGSRCARRPEGERCRATTFPSGSERPGRTSRSGGAGRTARGCGPCPVCDQVVIDPRGTLNADDLPLTHAAAELRSLSSAGRRVAKSACRRRHAVHRAPFGAESAPLLRRPALRRNRRAATAGAVPANGAVGVAGRRRINTAHGPRRDQEHGNLRASRPGKAFRVLVIYE